MFRYKIHSRLARAKLIELFPEREIKTDHDAVKLVEELGENASARAIIPINIR